MNCIHGNGQGYLGQNDLVARSSPVQVGSDTNWSDVVGGRLHWIAIKTDGTLWACGENGRLGSDGRLGDNTSIDRSSPVQIGSLTNWSGISSSRYHNLAFNSSGELYAWGNDGTGSLGINSSGADRSSPVQIGALTNWNGFVAAGPSLSLAVKSDGTLWVWGSAQSGALGTNNTTVSRSSPVQLGSLTNWSSGTASATSCAAVKTDGTLWAWGENAGNLGQNDTVSRSSPVQVGSESSWTNVSMQRTDVNRRQILATFRIT